MYKHPKGRREEGDRPFSVVPGDRTRQWTQTEAQEVHPIRKHFCTVSMVQHGHRLPREVVESPFLEITKICLDTVLGNLLEQEVGPGDPVICHTAPSNLSHLAIP